MLEVKCSKARNANGHRVAMTAEYSPGSKQSPLTFFNLFSDRQQIPQFQNQFLLKDI